MEERKRRIDAVTVATSRVRVALPWESRQQLVRYLGRFASDRDLVARFEAVGTTEPVRLSADQKSRLLVRIEDWWDELGAMDALPVGIPELRDELADDVHVNDALL